MVFSGYMPKNGIFESYNGKTVRYIYTRVSLVEFRWSLVVHSHKKPCRSVLIRVCSQVLLWIFLLDTLLDVKIASWKGSMPFRF